MHRVVIACLAYSNFIKCTEIHKKRKNIHLYEQIQAAYAGDRRYWNWNPCRRFAPGFEKGFTGYNGREENRSTGIGLYLCGKIMKRLDHGIRIESELGKGTKVFLELGRKKMESIFRACSEKTIFAVCMPTFRCILQIARLIFYML